MSRRVEGVPTLPPPEVRLLDPSETRIETPLDERGLVDLRALVTAVKGTVAPEYDWKSGYADDHHLQWPKSWYPSDRPKTNGMSLEQEFRNLEISKARLPRTFHNWVHQITVPPPLPDHEVMQYRVDAQRVVLSLFMSARDARRALKNKRISEATLATKLIQKTEQFFFDRERLLSLPSEFQLIENREPVMAANKIEDIVALGGLLGQFAQAQRVSGAFPSGALAAA